MTLKLVIQISLIKKHVYESRMSLILPDGKKSHLYVSYSGEDFSRVLFIVRELEQRYNVKCFLGDRDFSPGLISENVIDGIEQSWKVLMMISPNFIRSNQCRFETEVAYMEAGINGIIPVLLEDCQLPKPLVKLTYINASEPFCDVAANVFQAMINPVEKRTIISRIRDFHHGLRAKVDNDFNSNKQDQEYKVRHVMNIQLDDDLLTAYHTMLKEGSEEALHIRLMVVGMFGVGKSTLVRRLCGHGMKDIDSTVGIEIYRKAIEVKENGDWIIRADEEREKLFNSRLHMFIEKFRKKGLTGEAEKTRRENSENIPSTSHYLGQSQIEVGNNQSETIYNRKQQQKKKNIKGYFSKYFTFNSSTRKEDQEIEMKELKQSELTTELPSFREKLKRCGGIDVEKDLKERIQSGKKILSETRRPTLSVWDFAGQSVNYSTHHFFLNESSIYILTLDLSNDPKDILKETNVEENIFLGLETKYTCQQAVRFWIKSIYIYTQKKLSHASEGSQTVGSPKIILIGTKKDKIGEMQLNGRTYEKYKDDYFETVLRPFIDTPVQDMVHHKTFLISSLSEDDIDFLYIKQEILKVAQDMSSFRELVPAKFIPLERALFKLQNTESRIVRLEDIECENENAEVQCSTSEIKLFLAFQHMFGNIVYFNSDALNKHVILEPQWLIDVFKLFITHKPNKAMKEMKLWNELLDKGIVHDALIEHILHQRDFGSSKELIIEYMLYLDIIVRPVVFKADNDGFNPMTEKHVRNRSEDKCNTFPKVIEEDFFIMPCMLPQAPDVNSLGEIFKKVEHEEHTPTLCLYIKQGFFPQFVFHGILASLLKIYPINTMQCKNILYNRLGSFSITEYKYLTIWSWNETLHIRISFPSNTEEIFKHCWRIRFQIEDLLIQVFNLHRGYTFDHTNIRDFLDYRIKCPKCADQLPFEVNIRHENPNDYFHGTFSVAELHFLKTGMKKCASCGNMVDIHEILTFWFRSDIREQINRFRFDELEKEKEYSLDQEVSEWQEELFQTEKLPNEVMMALPEESLLVDIATDIQNLNGLHLELLISESTLETINLKWDRRKWPEEFKYHILYEWMKRGECWYILYSAMKKVGLNTDEFLRIISGVERGDINEKTEKILNELGIKENHRLDEIIILQISKCIGDEYWLFGIRLGIPQTELELLRHDYPSNEIVKKILQTWHKLDKGIGHLIKAFLKSRGNMPALIKVLQCWLKS